MSRYIDEISARENFQDVLAYMGSEVKRILKKVPTADVEEVRHGEYIQKGAWHIECSVCGNVLAHIGEVKNYCPNCDAKMDGERREGCDLRGDMWCKLNEENKKLTEENEYLKQQNEIYAVLNEKMECICNSYAFQYGTVIPKEVFLKKEREKAVKEMQKRLKSLLKTDYINGTREHALSVIDQIAKEMIGEGND